MPIDLVVVVSTLYGKAGPPFELSNFQGDYIWRRENELTEPSNDTHPRFAGDEDGGDSTC